MKRTPLATLLARNDDGTALIIAMMATMLLSALGMALVLTTSTETLIGTNHRASRQVQYAADAGLERALNDLLVAWNWDVVTAGTVKSSFIDTAPRVLPDGSNVDLAAYTANLQADTDATYSNAPNRPMWRLYGHGPMSRLLPTVTSRDYVIIWVADDPSETDGNPATDTNDVVILRAQAYGENGSRRAVEALVQRTTGTSLERGYVAQRGEGEHNRRQRQIGVGTPGQALTEMSMDINDGVLTVQ